MKIARFSGISTLHPGDIILTGAPGKSGTDQSIGCLRNPVVGEK